MTFTTHFELHSQTTRLVEDNLDIWRNIRPGTGFSPSMLSCSKEPRPAPSNKFVSPNYNSGTKRHRISNLSFCHFTRSYWGNPGWFLFLRLLICLSSAGIPTWSEVNLWIWLMLLWGTADWVKKLNVRISESEGKKIIKVIISPQIPPKPKYPTTKFQWGGEICQTYSGQAQQTPFPPPPTPIPPHPPDTEKKGIRDGC